MRERRVGVLSGAALVVLLAVLYLPVAYLVYASVNDNPLGTAWRGFTGRWFADAARSQEIRRSFWVSARLAAAASLGAVLVGTTAAIAVRRSTWMRRLSGVLAGMRVGVPEIIIATGLAVALPLVGMRFGFRAMLVAHVALLSAHVVLVVGACSAGSDRAMEEAALDLGANRWRMLRDVVLPDLRPAIVSSGLLAAAFSFDDVALSARLRGPRDTTLPVYLFSVVQRRVTPAIYAVGTVVVVGGAVMFAAAMAANRALRRPDLSR